MSADVLSLDLDKGPEIEAEDAFTVDVSGFEGPLHLLLDLARRQKVDLRYVSVLELSQQYLAFIEDARTKRIDLAAEYLLMAAWLAYLKSRLLLPKPEKETGGEESGEEMAAQLAFRLKRLEAMREAGDALMDGAILGETVFPRGAPQQPKVVKTTVYDTKLFELMQAFGSIRDRRTREAPHQITEQYVLPLERARDSLRGLRDEMKGWQSLDALRARVSTPGGRIPAHSVTASVFCAALELTRDGEFELRQDSHFAPLYLRGCEPQASEVSS